MKKRTYQAVLVKNLDLDQLSERFPEPAVVSVDVAKKTMYAMLMSLDQEPLVVLKWDHLSESRGVVAWLARHPQIQEVVMEPSGTYGDALRAHLEACGLTVFRVSPKQVKDAREIYDGVPSSHDAKASAIIAWLHLQGRSQRWSTGTDRERELKAALSVLRLHDRAFRQAQSSLEAQLARYWPEVAELLALDSVSLLELLSTFGGPAGVSSCPAEAENCLRKAGGALLAEDKIQKILNSARETIGVPMISAEVQALQDLGCEARRRQKSRQAAQQRLAMLSQNDVPTVLMARQVGRVTAAIVITELGPLANYAHVGALLKAAGLNLKEVSSGGKHGPLALTKRGSSLVRVYLFFAVLRWINKDPWARAWYEKKVQRDGGNMKRKAIVALMRKLLQGLWWVARGDEFDSTKLFDTSRLQPAS